MLRECNRNLLHAQCCVDDGFDKFQVFMSMTFQMNGGSADSMHVACRLAKRLFPIVPTVGSILLNGLNGNMAYYVIGIVQRSPYTSLLRIQSCTLGSRHPLP